MLALGAYYGTQYWTVGRFEVSTDDAYVQADNTIDLRLLLNRNFGVGTLANILVGFALFGPVDILPQYLAQVQHYNAEQIGNVLACPGPSRGCS